jgi:WhiB family redox-sensing transcriptional regulator
MKHRPGPDEEWRDFAACRSLDPVLAIRIFHPKQYEPIKPAIEICRTCAVMLECRKWALDNHEAHGVLGGMSETDRKRWWRAERRKPEPQPIVHGSPTGYQKHIRRGEPACGVCIDARQRDRHGRAMAEKGTS